MKITITRTRDRVEFYNGMEFLAGVDSSIIPPKGAYINISGQTWKVVKITYSLDPTERVSERSLKASIELKPTY